MRYCLKQKNGISIIGILFLGVMLILVLSYFKINIKEVVESPDAQNNINYVTNTSKSFWNKYLEKPVNYIWKEIFIAIFWQSFINNIEKIRDGEKTELEEMAPQYP